MSDNKGGELVQIEVRMIRNIIRDMGWRVGCLEKRGHDVSD